MRRVVGLLAVAIVCSWFGTSSAGDESPGQKVAPPPPLLARDLTPQMNGREVTVKFVIAGYEGVAQLAREDQAPTFIITTDTGEQPSRFDVWVEGELANVLDRLQMSYGREHRLKAGTTVIATGTLTAYTGEPRCYSLAVKKWQNFRVLPTAEK